MGYKEGVLELLPPEYWLGFFALLGATIGSFLNVVIVRLPAEESIIRPRSRCPSCHHEIAWYDNIPVLSYLLLRARCRYCGTKIALRYPLVEMLTALLVVALYIRFGLSWDLLMWLPLCAALVAITFLDIDHWWVPDVITYPAMAYAFAFSFAPGGLSVWQALAGLGPAIFLMGLAWLFERITRREGMGMGDMKLMALIGLAVGPLGAITVLLVGAIQGSMVGIVVTLTGGHHPESSRDPEDGASTYSAAGEQSGPGAGEIRSEPTSDEAEEDEWVPPPRAIPFGPFLALGCFELVLLPDTFGNLVTWMSELVERMAR